METNLVCIECPMGCDICVKMEKGKVLSVTGNGCPRGKTYAVNEVTCPKRVITTTVKSEDGRMVAVKTESPVDKAKTFEIMKKISAIIVRSPISIGQVITDDICDGVKLIATSNLSN